MADIYLTVAGDEGGDRSVRRDFEAGKLQPIASGIYVDGATEPVETISSSSIWANGQPRRSTPTPSSTKSRSAIGG